MINIDTTVGIAMPTASDWGQLYQFNTTGDAGLIMPPRSYYIRDFITGSWTDLAIGAIICATGTSGPQASLTAERQTETQLANIPQFGLSKSANDAININSNPFFVGLCGIIGSVTQLMTSPKQIAYMQATCINNGQTQGNGSAQILPLSSGTDDTQFVMWGLRFTYNPLTSILYINFSTQTGVTLTEDSEDETTLNPFLQGISNSTGTAIASFVIPNLADFKTFLIYWPYLNNQLKLHCVGVVQIS